jgi:NADH dehydrogenase FAD-containing subunit
MVEQRNIVIVGASVAGMNAAHNFLKFTLPTLKAKAEAQFHVYLINPSPNWYFRVASPRTAASTKRLPMEKIIFEIDEGFKKYSTDDYTFVEAFATGLDTKARTVSYRSTKSIKDEQLSYHALVIATGSSTYYQAFSQSEGTQEVIDAIKTTNKKVESAKDIVIVGGGATAVEFASEVGEHRNGKPGWFSDVQRKANITLMTADDGLLPTLRPAIGKTAEQKLKSLGVDVVYNARVVDAKEDTNGRTTITLAKGDKIEADFYVPAYGVSPNSSWLPSELLDERKYIKTDLKLRVEGAGPRVYAFGDVASYSRNNVWDILFAHPALAVNMKRDLLSYDPKRPDAKPKGQDRVYTVDTREAMLVPMGTVGGVGAVYGWRFPSFLIWLIKGRDFLVAMSGKPQVTGETVKEMPWSKEEAAI